MNRETDRKEFTELYREYIGEFDDNYKDETVDEKELKHEMYAELALIGVDIAKGITDEDLDRLERYRIG